MPPTLRPNLAGFAFDFVLALCVALLAMVGAVWLVSGGGC